MRQDRRGGGLDEQDATGVAELRGEVERLRAENRRLRTLLGADKAERAGAERPPTMPAWEPPLFHAEQAAVARSPVDSHSPPEVKIALFRSLFAGRDDVYAVWWENERSRKSGWSPAVIGGPANARRPDRAYLALTRACRSYPGCTRSASSRTRASGSMFVGRRSVVTDTDE